MPTTYLFENVVGIPQENCHSQLKLNLPEIKINEDLKDYVRACLENIITNTLLQSNELNVEVQSCKVQDVHVDSSIIYLVNAYIVGKHKNESVVDAHLVFNLQFPNQWGHYQGHLKASLPKSISKKDTIYIARSSEGVFAVRWVYGLLQCQKVELNSQLVATVADSYQMNFHPKSSRTLSDNFIQKAPYVFYQTIDLVKFGAKISANDYWSSASIPVTERQSSLLETFLSNRSIAEELVNMPYEFQQEYKRFLLETFTEELDSNLLQINTALANKFFDILFKSDLNEQNKCLLRDIVPKLSPTYTNKIYLKYAVLGHQKIMDSLSNIDVTSKFSFSSLNYVKLMNLFSKDWSEGNFLDSSDETYLTDFIEDIKAKSISYDGHESIPDWLQVMRQASKYLASNVRGNKEKVKSHKKAALAILIELFAKVEELTDSLYAPDNFLGSKKAEKIYYSTQHIKILFDAAIGIEKFLEKARESYSEQYHDMLDYSKSLLSAKNEEKEEIEMTKFKYEVFYLLLKRCNNSLTSLIDQQRSQSHLKDSIDSMTILISRYFPDIRLSHFSKFRSHDDIICLLYRLLPITVSDNKDLANSAIDLIGLIGPKIGEYITGKNGLRYFNANVEIDKKTFDTATIYILATEAHNVSSPYIDSYVNQVKEIIYKDNVELAREKSYLGPLYYSKRGWSQLFAFTVLSTFNVALSILYISAFFVSLLKLKLVYLSMFRFLFHGIYGIILPTSYIASLSASYYLGRDIFTPKIDDAIAFDWSACRVSTDIVDQVSSNNTSAVGIDIDLFDIPLEQGYSGGNT